MRASPAFFICLLCRGQKDSAIFVWAMEHVVDNSTTYQKVPIKSGFFKM
jgi:hypothetical protein